MLRGASVFFDKPLYLLEARDNALLARRASALFIRLCEFGEFFCQFVKSGHA